MSPAIQMTSEKKTVMDPSLRWGDDYLANLP